MTVNSRINKLEQHLTARRDLPCPECGNQSPPANADLDNLDPQQQKAAETLMNLLNRHESAGQLIKCPTCGAMDFSAISDEDIDEMQKQLKIMEANQNRLGRPRRVR